MLFFDHKDGGALWTGNGAREVRRVVGFEERFPSDPVVQVGLSMWGMAQKTNQRADTTAGMVNGEGFVIVFRTWGDTRVARVRPTGSLSAKMTGT